MIRRPDRAQLADHYARVWECERDDAQAVPCPTCGALVDATCVNSRTGQPVTGPPAHPARISAAAAAAEASRTSRSSLVTATLRSPAA